MATLKLTVQEVLVQVVVVEMQFLQSQRPVVPATFVVHHVVYAKVIVA